MPDRQDRTPTLAMREALDRSEPLGQLLHRLHEARARFEAVADALPPNLREDVRPGPVDTDGWTLLAAHNAAAAKLRQLLPHLQQRLQQAGWQPTSIRVRVQPRNATR